METQERAKAGALDFLWLELTNKCPLRCRHCYADAGPTHNLHESMQVNDWERIIDDAYALGCRSLQFIGGEPAMCPELPQLISRADTLGFTFIEMFTTGFNLRDGLKQVLIRHRVHLAFSVYSHRPEVHDQITNLAGSHATTLEVIRWALEHKLPVRAAIIEMVANNGDTEETKSMLQALGVENIGVDRERGVGRGVTSHVSDDPMDELCGKCWKGRLCVTPSGDAYPCVFSRKWSVGKASDGLRNILNGMELTEFRSALREKRERVLETVNVCVPQCGPDCTPACIPSPGISQEYYMVSDSTCTPQCGPDCTPACIPSPG